MGGGKGEKSTMNALTAAGAAARKAAGTKLSGGWGGKPFRQVRAR